MERENEKMVYQIDSIEAIDNSEEFDMAFPILNPNTNYFRDLNTLLNSYGLPLQTLGELNYSVEDYIDYIKNNRMLNSFHKESEFIIENHINDEDEDLIMDSEYFDMVVSSSTGEVVFGVKYHNNRLVLKDTQEEIEYIVHLHIDLDYLNFYFTGSYCYINDSKNNKQHFIYLD